MSQMNEEAKCGISVMRRKSTKHAWNIATNLISSHCWKLRGLERKFKGSLIVTSNVVYQLNFWLQAMCFPNLYWQPNSCTVQPPPPRSCSKTDCKFLWKILRVPIPQRSEGWYKKSPRLTCTCAYVPLFLIINSVTNNLKSWFQQFFLPYFIIFATYFFHCIVCNVYKFKSWCNIYQL